MSIEVQVMSLLLRGSTTSLRVAARLEACPAVHSLLRCAIAVNLTLKIRYSLVVKDVARASSNTRYFARNYRKTHEKPLSELTQCYS